MQKYGEEIGDAEVGDEAIYNILEVEADSYEQVEDYQQTVALVSNTFEAGQTPLMMNIYLVADLIQRPSQGK